MGDDEKESETVVYWFPHADTDMEAKLKEANRMGFEITYRRAPVPWGEYYKLVDGCTPAHIGTVSAKDTDPRSVEGIMTRCENWLLEEHDGPEGEEGA